MTFADDLKKRVAESIATDADPAHVITWLLCRYAYAAGFVKGVECGKAHPTDDKSGTMEEGHWFAGYALADPSPLNPDSTSDA